MLDKENLDWIDFYMEFADDLLSYKNDREALISGIHEIAQRRADLPTSLEYNGELLQDICPFTVMGIFNRSLTYANRKALAGELGDFLQVRRPRPDSFDSIPTLNNKKSWFHGPWESSKPDIDKLWRVFADAIEFADSDQTEPQSFIESYNKALSIKGVAYNLSTGLYWIRPWEFLTLDVKSRNYFRGVLRVPPHLLNKTPNGQEYLRLRDNFKRWFNRDDQPFRSFPNLSFAAYHKQNHQIGFGPVMIPNKVLNKGPRPVITPTPQVRQPAKYTIEDIIKEGCFLGSSELEKALKGLMYKKNLILQGPPGTGKTWLAKKLAFALIGHKDVNKIKSFQFHPNLSYEDFVRGYRPGKDGRLELVDGPFIRVIDEAKKKDDPDNKYVILIEEINRAKPSQIFGEMLTLLESDKRKPEEAVALGYSKYPGEKVHIPHNVYLIGTMNVADRSIALVDFAMRRRFAFMYLKPEFGTQWRNWVHEHYKIGTAFLDEVANRMNVLNKEIENDRSLGLQFKVGHSYVTPSSDKKIDEAKGWFKHVVETEIGPLLDEYWFDNPDQAKKQKEKLLAGL